MSVLKRILAGEESWELGDYEGPVMDGHSSDSYGSIHSRKGDIIKWWCFANVVVKCDGLPNEDALERARLIANLPNIMRDNLSLRKQLEEKHVNDIVDYGIAYTKLQAKLDALVLASEVAIREEYAQMGSGAPRKNGHLNLLRLALDGAKGG